MEKNRLSRTFIDEQKCFHIIEVLGNFVIYDDNVTEFDDCNNNHHYHHDGGGVDGHIYL